MAEPYKILSKTAHKWSLQTGRNPSLHPVYWVPKKSRMSHSVDRFDQQNRLIQPRLRIERSPLRGSGRGGTGSGS